MKDFLYLLLTGLGGTFGFAALLHAPRRSWLPAGVLGGLSYALYWTMNHLAGVDDAAAMFIGCLVGSFLAQLLARRMQMIATIFVSLSIIPCVPGLGLYRCLSLLGQGNHAEGLAAGVTAMVEIMMIALALGVSGFLVQLPGRLRAAHALR